MLDNLRYDIKRYLKGHENRCFLLRAKILLLDLGFWAVCVYRYARWTQRIRYRLIRFPFSLLSIALGLLVEIATGAKIVISAEIGPGLLVHLPSGIVISGKLGRHCTVVSGAQIQSRANWRDSG
ncbi:MAG: hypothetical protein JSW03_03315, partial [Candidatus Eiseniibacteriota bacterium]